MGKLFQANLKIVQKSMQYNENYEKNWITLKKNLFNIQTKFTFQRLKSYIAKLKMMIVDNCSNLIAIINRLLKIKLNTYQLMIIKNR